LSVSLLNGNLYSMKKKHIRLFAIIFCLGFTYYYLKNGLGWLEFRKNTDTPKEFLNHAVNGSSGYTKDSIEVIRQLKNLLLNHKGSFHSPDYFDYTELIIDSLLYSPDLNKLAVFVIAKNPTYRQLLPDSQHPWYYNATSYLGVRQNDTVCLSLLGPNFTNYIDKEEVSDDIRETCFRLFISEDTTGRYTCKYNLNDVRFWDSPIWEEMEEQKERVKKFEEEKRMHPENVYEPPKQ
jgi:hypothetical protein